MKTLSTEIYRQNIDELLFRLKSYWDRDGKYWGKPIGGLLLLCATVWSGIMVIEFREIDGREYKWVASYDETYRDKIPGFSEKIREVASDGKINGHELTELRDMIEVYTDEQDAIEAAEQKAATLKQIEN